MVEPFLEKLPGFPDNIRYDGEGHFWIGLPLGTTSRMWDVILRYPWVRNVMGAALMNHFDMWVHHLYRGSGVLCTSLEGEALALYTDPDLPLVTVGLKIGKSLYYDSLFEPLIRRVRLLNNQGSIS